MPGINNYNPIKNKSKKFNNFYNNDLNLMQNNPRQNNFIKRSNRSNYDRFNINNYDSSKPIKLLQSGHKKSASIDKPSKKSNNSNYLYNQQFMLKPQNKIRHSVDLKRPSTAPQKYKISKNKGNILGNPNKENFIGLNFGLQQPNQNNKMPNSYSNGFYKNNKRLSSPMVSFGQKFGATHKFKFNNYRMPNPGQNLFSFKKK